MHILRNVTFNARLNISYIGIILIELHTLWLTYRYNQL